MSLSTPEQPSPASRELRTRELPIRELLKGASLWAVLAAILCFLLTGLVSLVVRYVRQDRLVDPYALILGLAELSLIFGLIVFVGRILGSSRVLLARTFGITAFCATWFGLVMLVIFLVSIGRDVIAWFEVMPKLVEQNNREVRERLKQVEEAQKFIDNELAKIDREEQKELKRAASEEEKKEIQSFYLDVRQRKLEDLKSTIPEIKGNESQIREDTSRATLFWDFLTKPPSDRPEDAGIWPALIGSLILGIVTLVIAVPLGVGAAIYLEEYRQKGWLNRFIQVNISNLAGVPSVVFGILGGFVFVDLIFQHLHGRVYTPGFLTWILGESLANKFMHNVFGDTIEVRNTLGGAMTLAILTLPLIIVSAQEAIRAVPVSIRHGALALGATRWQVVWHHVLPSARPGILTGSILSLSRALGEAAPLVMFGVLIHVTKTPTLLSDFTVMPMQIFSWSVQPSVPLDDGTRVEAWRYNAAMASMILLVTILGLNAIAIVLRNRAQRQIKW
jgi:phosphate transport system permease protein